MSSDPPTRGAPPPPSLPQKRDLERPVPSGSEKRVLRRTVGLLAALAFFAVQPEASAQTVPTVLLEASRTTLKESGDVATITARLTGASSEATTVRIAAVPPGGRWIFPSAFQQRGIRMLIAAGATTSTGLVTITAVDNAVDGPDGRVEVTGTAAGGGGVMHPASVWLTLADDEGLRLVASSPTITEAGGVATVTATLGGASSEAATVTVTATAVPPTGGGTIRSAGGRW